MPAALSPFARPIHTLNHMAIVGEGDAGMVYVFDPAQNDWIIETPKQDEPMPGTRRQLIRYGDFLGPCKTDLAWSDLRALDALELLLLYAAPHRLRYGFRRVAQRVHVGQSAHYCGLAFHIGVRLTPREQVRLIRLALDVCGFDRVEPPNNTPGWVHVEKYIAPPANLKGGYPALQAGEQGVHVLLLQDALNLQGFGTHPLSGQFSAATAADVRHYQYKNELPPTGRVDGATWHSLIDTLPP